MACAWTARKWHSICESFRPGQRERFVTSVTRGKNQMPPWGDFFKPDQLDGLWAYVSAGERN
jgi:hypothetical protein